jgi:hypothetical protein
MEGSGRSVIWGPSSAVDWGKPRTNRSQGRRPRGRDWNREPAEYEAGVLTTSMWPSEDASWLLITDGVCEACFGYRVTVSHYTQRQEWCDPLLVPEASCRAVLALQVAMLFLPVPDVQPFTTTLLASSCRQLRFSVQDCCLCRVRPQLLTSGGGNCTALLNVGVSVVCAETLSVLCFICSACYFVWQYQVTIKKQFAAQDNGDINRAWDFIGENINISAIETVGLCESKSHKPWFDEECLKLVDRRKQAKLQWLQDPSEVNERNLSDVRRETSRHFRNKKREYLKDEVNDIEPNSKNKNIRNLYAGITEYKKQLTW